MSEPSEHERTGFYPDYGEKLTATLDALVRDAQRYRKLRAMHWSNSPLAVVSTSLLPVGTTCYSRDHLDDVLDRLPTSPV